MSAVAILTTLTMGMCFSAAEAAAPPREVVEYTARGGLPNFFARLNRGDRVRIGYLGGSITAQAGWRPKTLSWFREQFPKAKISEINAAIGGTGSDLGVYRLRHDVLRHDPDLLFVEFAVNDGGAAPERILKAMEGIIRQTWKHNPETDICFVYTLTQGMLKNLQDGKYPRAAGVMERLADFYRIPSIHMGLRVARMEKEGTVIFKTDKPVAERLEAMKKGLYYFSKDGVHPYTDTGHILYLEAVARAMKAMEKAGTPGPHALAKPLRADNWEAAKMLPLSRAVMSADWRRLEPATDNLAKHFANRLPELWACGTPGATITFSFRGTDVKIYDLLGPDCGQVTVTVDGGKPVTRPRFDAYCTYHRLATLTIASGLPDTVHSVKLEISSAPIDKLKILHKRTANAHIKELDPKKYGGTMWYAGMIMLIGDLVEK
jgi:lysophospholipase L1-like esterase